MGGSRRLSAGRWRLTGSSLRSTANAASRAGAPCAQKSREERSISSAAVLSSGAPTSPCKLSNAACAARRTAGDPPSGSAIELESAGIAGGSVYDALVGAVAAEHDVSLATRDRHALDVYRMLGVRVELLA